MVYVSQSISSSLLYRNCSHFHVCRPALSSPGRTAPGDVDGDAVSSWSLCVSTFMSLSGLDTGSVCITKFTCAKCNVCESVIVNTFTYTADDLRALWKQLQRLPDDGTYGVSKRVRELIMWEEYISCMHSWFYKLHQSPCDARYI